MGKGFTAMCSEKLNEEAVLESEHLNYGNLSISIYWINLRPTRERRKFGFTHITSHILIVNIRKKSQKYVTRPPSSTEGKRRNFIILHQIPVLLLSRYFISLFRLVMPWNTSTINKKASKWKALASSAFPSFAQMQSSNKEFFPFIFLSHSLILSFNEENRNSFIAIRRQDKAQ